MGRMQAEEMAGLTDLRQGILWHLQSNHFPPVHPVFVDVAIEAIEAVNDGEDPDITMPNGVVLPAGSIVSQLHLEPWLDQDDDDWEPEEWTEWEITMGLDN